MTSEITGLLLEAAKARHDAALSIEYIQKLELDLKKINDDKIKYELLLKVTTNIPTKKREIKDLIEDRTRQYNITFINLNNQRKTIADKLDYAIKCEEAALKLYNMLTGGEKQNIVNLQLILSQKTELL